MIDNSQKTGNNQLLNASQRIRSDKKALSSLNRIFQLASQPNQSLYKMIEAEKNNQKRQQQNPNKFVSIRMSQNESSVTKPDNVQKKQRKVYELQRKIPVKQDLGFLGKVLKYLLIGFVIVFAIDFYFELQNEMELKQNQIAKCYQDYHENNCIQPRDALIQECERLNFCASREAKSILKYSTVFLKTLVGLIQYVASHLQITGMVFVAILIIIYLNRPTMYHQEKVYKYE